MGGLSLMHWIIVGVIVLVLFGGRGKISDIMGDVAKGIKSFKKGMADEDVPPAPPPAQPSETIRAEAPVVIEHQRDIEIPGAPAPKARAKAPAKAATAKKAPAAAKAPAVKKPASRKKADS